MNHLGQDVLDHLHDPGGPLHAHVGMQCDQCEGDVDEGRAHIVPNPEGRNPYRIVCDYCAISEAIKYPESEMARDVIRQIGAEMLAGKWRFTG